MIKDTVINAFKQAIKEIWQDKRTLWSRLWLPFLMFGILLFLLSISLDEMGGSSNFSGGDNANVETPNSIVGIVANNNGDSLIQQLKVIESVDYILLENTDTLQYLIENGGLELGVVIDDYFDDALKTGNTGEILLYYDGYNDALKTGITDNIAWYERRILNKRMEKSGMNDAFTNPINIGLINSNTFDSEDLTLANDETDEATVFNEIGGIFIWLLLLFCWLGGVYPALSLFTNEVTQRIITDKPKTILIGRILAVAAFSLLHSLLLYFVFILIFQPFSSGGSFYSNMIKLALNADLMPVIIFTLIPLSLLFASFLSWSTMKRGTFKEAQNRIQPLKVSIGMLLVIGLTGGLGINVLLSLVPLINIGQLSRLLLQDNLNWLYLILTYAATFIYAYACFTQGLKEFEKRVQPIPKPVFIAEVDELNNDIEIVDEV
jgi:hypothetical protein